MKKNVADYLKTLKMENEYTYEYINCEICNSNTKTNLLHNLRGPENLNVDLAVVACGECGHIYQELKFEYKFYQEYYDRFYRLNLFGESEPDKLFFLDQIKRGDNLYKNLEKYLPKVGKLVDIGCSSGGLMIPFAKRGWKVFGTDPDTVYVDFGKKVGLEIEATTAEKMETDENETDLIIINGSLEHMFDVNIVLNKCTKMAKDKSLLLIEGRALGYGIQLGYLTHNHRRYLSAESIELLMMKYKWFPILVTDSPLCGPTRPGAVFVLAIKEDSIKQKEIELKKKENLEKFKEKYLPIFNKWNSYE